MAYVLLATGALMLISGIYAVVTGYPIVQVEQGWASVIAGATLIAGGVVTAALGLILRTLQQLKTATFGLPAAAPVLHLEPAIPAIAASQALAASSLEPAPALHIAEAPTPPAPEPEPEPLPLVEPDPVHAEPEAVEAPPVPEPETPAIEPPPAVAHEEPEPVAPPPEEEPHPAPPVAMEEPATPPMDDWLDRAFADIDRDLSTPTLAHVEPAHEPAALEPPVPEPTMREPAFAEAEAPHEAAAEAPAAPPPAPAAESNVIGRYEADGTSYVMYADGSIEAQSDGGVYRFSSMAELKAFIEG